MIDENETELDAAKGIVWGVLLTLAAAALSIVGLILTGVIHP